MDPHLETSLGSSSGDAIFWAARFRQQVGWTNATRRYLFDRLNISPDASILEVGCGSGAVLDALQADGYTCLTGLDVDWVGLRLAEPIRPLVCGDGLHLPFAPGRFDAAVCHFLLMWVADPLVVLEEMARVTRTGGYAVILAEPDYAGRMDYPPPLEKLGHLQTEALQSQGANTFIGKQLKELLVLNGYTQVHTGLISTEWPPETDATERKLEWQVLEKDLAGRLPESELQQFQLADEQAWKTGTRILYVPIFYAWGQVAQHQLFDLNDIMV